MTMLRPKRVSPVPKSDVPIQELVSTTQIPRQGTQFTIRTPDPGGSFRAYRIATTQAGGPDMRAESKVQALEIYVWTDLLYQIACTDTSSQDHIHSIAIA
jgi:hypothetical protein